MTDLSGKVALVTGASRGIGPVDVLVANAGTGTGVDLDATAWNHDMTADRDAAFDRV
jgi:short-subunit dehydrogenase